MDVTGTQNHVQRIVGYARVSTYDQCLDLQINALNQFGCDEIFCDEGVSGGIHPHKREQFQIATSRLSQGSTLAVWKLDRLGRTLKGVIDTVDSLKDNDIQFVSLTENIDTTTATGRAFWQFIGLMAELERGLIRERTIEGMKAARLRGVRIGRPCKLSERTVRQLDAKIKTGQSSITEAARLHAVSPSTVRRALAKL